MMLWDVSLLSVVKKQSSVNGIGLKILLGQITLIIFSTTHEWPDFMNMKEKWSRFTKLYDFMLKTKTVSQDHKGVIIQ